MVKLRQNKIKLSVMFIILSFLLLIANGCEKSEKSFTTKEFPIIKKEQWTEIGDNIVVFTSSFSLVNMTLVHSNGEGVLIDTGMYEEDGERIQNFLEEKNIKLRNIILTHNHRDHTANVAKLKTDEMSTIRYTNASEGQIIDVGNKSLRIVYTEGHLPLKEHISIEIVNDNILIAGDIIGTSTLPLVGHGGKTDDLLNTLDELKNKDYIIIIPGHGEIVSPKTAFERQSRYLNNAKELLIEAKKDGEVDFDSIKVEDCIKDVSYLIAYSTREQLEDRHKDILYYLYLEILKNDKNY